jgi:hypothetical protein
MLKQLDEKSSERLVPLIIKLMQSLTDEHRLEVFSCFCKYCGTEQPRCQCWNDE